ncbi:MAG: hypothetical protein Kow0075_15320 [Salibacteraceae bacterium]
MKAQYVVMVVAIVGMLAGASCRSTKFPADRETKRAYRQQEDREITTPREKDYDRKSGLGGGHEDPE